MGSVVRGAEARILLATVAGINRSERAQLVLAFVYDAVARFLYLVPRPGETGRSPAPHTRNLVPLCIAGAQVAQVEQQGEDHPEETPTCKP
jgi:hypothetical protein